MAKTKLDYNREVWEGWCPYDFITEIEDDLDYRMSRPYKSPLHPKNREELRELICDLQPYYKKPIPEVEDYFFSKYGY